MEDKVAHSAVGLGFYLAIAVTCLFSLEIALYLFIVLFSIAIGKEIYDQIRYQGFDVEDFFATMNPMIVIKWYLSRTKEASRKIKW